MASRPPPERTVLESIQHLRGLAALGVAVFHAGRHAGVDLPLGSAGVDVFFVISGFIIWMITADGGASPGRFLADRFMRIMPTYWLATTVLLLGGLAGLFPRLVIEPWHVVTSYLLIPDRGPTGEIAPLLFQGWSLSYEMLFYLAFAAVLPFSNRVRFLAVGAGLPVMILALALAPRSTATNFFGEPIMLEFVAGMAIAEAWRQGRNPPATAGWALLAVGGAALFLLHATAPGAPRALAFGAPAFLLVAGAVILERRGAWPKSRTGRLLGDASYSIYLWHTFGISVVAMALTLSGVSGLWIVPATVAGGVAAGLGGYALLERPLMKAWRSRRGRPGAARKTEAAGAG